MFFTLQRHDSNEAIILEIEDLRDLLNMMEFDSYVEGFTSGDKLVYRDESERKYFEEESVEYKTLKREDDPELYDALADFGKKVFDVDIDKDE